MSERILVTYATRFGSTAEIAARIGEVLKRDGVVVDVLPVENVRSLRHYSAVVLGSPIRGSKWVQEATDFLAAHRAELSRVPVAYFTVCLTLHENTAENRRIVRAYHDPLLQEFPEVHPASIGMFAGKIDYNRLSWILRLMAKSAKVPEGDWRNWRQIEDWARSILPQLIGQPSSS